MENLAQVFYKILLYQKKKEISFDFGKVLEVFFGEEVK
jgi:hypothetical protein